MIIGRKRGTRGRLGQKQLEARYEWLWKYHKQHHMMPSHAELAEAWGITTGVVRHTLNRLHGFGWLVTEYREQRSIQLLRQLD